MVNNHMEWIPKPDSDKGDLYAVFHGEVADLPSFRDIAFAEAVELVTTYPPRTAVQRHVS